MIRKALINLLIVLAAVGATASAVAADVKPILGYLGQATEKTRIYASPNSHARVFSRVRSKQYLVIRNYERNMWYQVLLQNGIYGFVPASAVKQLPYEVTPRTPGVRGNFPLADGDSPSRGEMADYALHFIGTPYVWGGNNEYGGIDCSGFVQKMYGKVVGMQLPRTAAEQALVGQPIYRLEDLRKGDRLYFWESKRGKIGHTGIYLGNGYFVHSSHGKGGVSTDYLTASWRRILVAARR